MPGSTLSTPLSFREVEELMLERGVLASYETVRRLSAKFAQSYQRAAPQAALSR